MNLLSPLAMDWIEQLLFYEDVLGIRLVDIPLSKETMYFQHTWKINKNANIQESKETSWLNTCIKIFCLFCRFKKKINK